MLRERALSEHADDAHAQQGVLLLTCSVAAMCSSIAAMSGGRPSTSRARPSSVFIISFLTAMYLRYTMLP